MKINQLRRLQREAKRLNPNAKVIHTKRGGYFLFIEKQEIPLCKDSIEALFRLEKTIKAIAN